MKNKRRKKRSCDFKPTRDEINLAVKEYLFNGGRITKCVVDDTVNPDERVKDYHANDFLAGEHYA